MVSIVPICFKNYIFFCWSQCNSLTNDHAGSSFSEEVVMFKSLKVKKNRERRAAGTFFKSRMTKHESGSKTLLPIIFFEALKRTRLVTAADYTRSAFNLPKQSFIKLNAELPKDELDGSSRKVFH